MPPVVRRKRISMDEGLLKSLQSAFERIDSKALVRCSLVVAIAILIFIALRIVYRKYRQKITELGDVRRLNTLATVYRVAKITLITVTLLGILQVCGVNISSIVMGLGVVTTVIAFAVKDALQDIFTGLMIKTDRFFQVGDAVEYDGRDGIVIYFSIRATKIEFLDDRSILSVANRNISKIRRLTHLVDIDIPLSYDALRQDVFAVLERICADIRTIEGVEDCMLKGTQSFAESAVIYKIRFFCEPNDRPDIRREANKRVQDGLNRAGLRIPYLQVDVHDK